MTNTFIFHVLSLGGSLRCRLCGQTDSVVISSNEGDFHLSTDSPFTASQISSSFLTIPQLTGSQMTQLVEPQMAEDRKRKSGLISDTTEEGDQEMGDTHTVSSAFHL